MTNFNRNYRVVINVEGERITVEPPLKITFSGVSSTGLIANSLELKIYNLNQAHRNTLVKEPEPVAGQPAQVNFRLALLIGYGSSLKLMYDGFVTSSGSKREGAEIVTSISCRAALPDIQSSWLNSTVISGETFNVALEKMPNTTLGAVSKDLPKLKRPRVIVGGAFDQLKKAYPEHRVTIVNGRLYILAEDEALITSTIPVISADTGLIDTPTRYFSKITLTALLNPIIEPFTLFKLESSIQPHLNRVYEAWNITYSGDTWGEDWKMTIVAHAFIRNNNKEYQRGENA